MTPILTQQHAFGSSLADDWLENPKKWLRQLIVEVVLRVDANVVLNHIYRILQNHQHTYKSSTYLLYLHIYT